MALLTSVTAAGTNGATTGSINTSGATLLVVIVTDYSGGGGVSVSDSKSNTWTFVDEYSFGAGAQIQMYYAQNPTVGSGHTFTVSGTGVYSSIYAAAFSNMVLSSVYDGVQNGSVDANVSTVNAGSVTPSQSNTVVVAGMGVRDNATSMTIDTGFTLIGFTQGVPGVSYGIGMAYRALVGAIALNPAWSWTNSVTEAVGIIAVFRAVATFFGGDEGAVWYMSIEREW